MNFNLIEKNNNNKTTNLEKVAPRRFGVSLPLTEPGVSNRA